MLLRFACSNFKSIKDRQEILFTAAKGVKNLPDAPRTVEGYKKNQLLPVIAVYGANASGKSNMLEALAFIKRAALRSHVDWENGIPRKPFRLDPASADLPSTFDIDFLIGSTRYHYGFSVDDEKVLEEWLYAVKPGRAQQVWFERKAGEKIAFGKPLKVLGEALEKAELIDSNGLIVSQIIQSNNDVIKEINVFFWVGIVENQEWGNGSTLFMHKNNEKWSEVNNLIRYADFGISFVEVKETVIPSINFEGSSIVGTWDVIYKHKNNDYEFRQEDESSGTQRLFRIAGPLIKTLEDGSCICFDELETSLHPLLARAIIRLFMDPKTNPKGAQLFFTTHDKSLLAKEVLRRDQVWLTEKDRVGGTHVYPLSDFDINDDTDLEGAYLEGRFGGVPLVRNLLPTTAS